VETEFALSERAEGGYSETVGTVFRIKEKRDGTNSTYLMEPITLLRFLRTSKIFLFVTFDLLVICIGTIYIRSQYWETKMVVHSEGKGNGEGNLP